MSKKLDLSKVGPGRTNIDRKCEQEARPSSGSDNRAAKGSQSNGAGSANGRGSEILNGRAILLGSLGQTERAKGPITERVSVSKSKTSSGAVQDAKKKIRDRENGTYDRTGGQS